MGDNNHSELGFSETPIVPLVYSPEAVARILSDLESLLADPKSEMTHEDLVNLADTLARLVCDRAMATRIMRMIDSVIVRSSTPDSIDGRTLSKLLSSYAQIGFVEGQLIQFLLQRDSYTEFEPCHIAGIMCALGRMKNEPTSFISPSKLNLIVVRLCNRCTEISVRFSPSEISTLVLSLARFNFRNTKMLKWCIAKIVARMRDLNPQVISNTIYALGKLGYKSTDLLDAACAWCVSRFGLFKTQELANIVYAIGLLEYHNPVFMAKLGDHIPSRMAGYKTQELSITLYSYGQLKISHPRLFLAVGSEIAQRLDECSSQSISNTVYAMSRVHFYHTGLFGALGFALPSRLHDLAPQHISNIMLACGKLGHRDDVLLESICAHIPSRLFEFRPQNIANTVYATGRLGFCYPPLLDAVAEHLPLRLPECVSQDISNIIYAFGQLRYSCPEFFAQCKMHVIDHLAKRMTQKDLSFMASAFRKIHVDLFDDVSPSVSSTYVDSSAVADEDELVAMVEDLMRSTREY
jgi:hypothetical protein